MISGNLGHGVSLVICCHNSAERLPETINHIKAQQVPEHIPWELIVIDNASTDGTSKIANNLWGSFQGAPLSVVEEPRLGLSNARVRGFEQAQYEYVCFVDDDNWLAPNWVAMVNQIMDAHPDAGACGGRSEIVSSIEPPDWLQPYYSWLAIGDQAEVEGNIANKRLNLWGAGLTVRKAAWRQIQSLRWRFLLSDRKGKTLSGGADSELCIWLRFLGWQLFYSPRLSLKHYMPEKRMRWAYFVQAAQSCGDSKMILRLYKKEQNVQGRFGISLITGIKQWISSLLYFTPYKKRALNSTKTGNQPGNIDYLMALQTRAIFFSLVRCGPIKYYGLIRQIRAVRLCGSNE